MKSNKEGTQSKSAGKTPVENLLNELNFHLKEYLSALNAVTNKKVLAEKS